MPPLANRFARPLAGLRLDVAWIWRPAAPDLWAILAAVAVGGLALARARLVDDAYGRYVGCHRCFDSTVWANDAYLFAGFAALLAISRAATDRIARVFLVAVALAGVIAYGTDLVVFRLLSRRLLLADLVHYGGEGSLLLTVVRPLWRHPHAWAFAATVLVALVAATRALWLRRPDNRSAAAWATAACLAALGAYAAPRVEYVHESILANLWQVNLESDGSRPYSAAYAQSLRHGPTAGASCESGASSHPSIVLAVVESLSAYHSRLFSGLNDYTPQLDALARRGAYFTRFHANGYSTEGGLIALLTGRVPIPTAGRTGTALAFTTVEGDFHRRLTAHGYDTTFFTTGDLGFGARERWLRDIGIEWTEGADSPYYAGMPRGSFDAAEDGALVERFLHWHAERRTKRPFMATLLTVATHPPFYSPTTGGMDEARRFHDVDAALGHLARTLERRGFFEAGMLLVVGDHRAMTPISAAELGRLGREAPVSIPFIAVGRTGLPAGEQRGDFQQTDLIPSLRFVVEGGTCRTAMQGRMLGPQPRPARYVVHADPLRRDRLVVLEDGERHHIVLDGDDTRWMERPPPDGAALLARINRERVDRMAELAAPALR